MKDEIIIFENQTVKLEVNMKDETVWLNIEQMAKLFERNRTVILRHINNIFNEEELNRKEVCAKFAHTSIHGSIKDKTQTKLVDYYNLDVIISVGYRVKSKNGIIFRRWANKVLKDYLIKGYAVNNKRLESLEKVVKLIDIASRNNSETSDIIKIIDNYSKSLNILDNYDNNTINKVSGTISNKKIKYNDCIDIINKLKENENSNIFALERNRGLENIINSIYQTYNNIDVYESIEEKAANFLYLIVKDHIFIDGNKRIGATLFIYF